MLVSSSSSRIYVIKIPRKYVNLITFRNAVNVYSQNIRSKVKQLGFQLDATDELLLQILLLAQHVSGTIMPIISSSRVVYKWLLPVVFGAWFSSCRYGVELRVMCPDT